MRWALTWGVAIVLCLIAGVGAAWWAVQVHRDDCARREQVVLSIARNDPGDLKGALDLYAQNCP